MLTEMLFAAARSNSTHRRIDTLIEIIKKLEQRVELLERKLASLEASQTRS